MAKNDNKQFHVGDLITYEGAMSEPLWDSLEEFSFGNEIKKNDWLLVLEILNDKIDYTWFKTLTKHGVGYIDSYLEYEFVS